MRIIVSYCKRRKWLIQLNEKIWHKLYLNVAYTREIVGTPEYLNLSYKAYTFAFLTFGSRGVCVVQISSFYDPGANWIEFYLNTNVLCLKRYQSRMRKSYVVMTWIFKHSR